jgi:ABC-type Fe3+-siderophore transport system permease subunit
MNKRNFERRIIHFNFSGLWYFLALLLYLLVPGNEFAGGIFTAFLGRFYIIYFIVRHSQHFFDFLGAF